MNWDAIGAIGEIVGAVAVVISLLYLALQMRQNNKLVERNAVKEVIAERAEYNKFVASSPELSELYWKGMSNPEQLSEAEWLRYLSLFAPMARQLEASFIDMSHGYLTESRSASELKTMNRWLSQPGPQKYFQELGDGYDRDFIDKVVMKSRNQA